MSELQPDPYALAILAELNRRHTLGGVPMYLGTVGYDEKRRRRAAGKRQRAARKIHRGRR